MRLPRVRKVPKQRMCVPANLDCVVFEREKHGPTEQWGRVLWFRQKTADL